jgi:hypothetical protein
MKNHEHYYHWTIEWEEDRAGSWRFYLGREEISAYDGQKTKLNTQIGAYPDIERGISRSKDLIDEILAKQNLIAEKVLNMQP